MARERRRSGRSTDPIVLIVDDHVDSCDMYQVAFQAVGLSTICAFSVKIALEIAVEHQPAIIVTDLGMPGEDGWSLLDALKQQAPHIPVVIVSAHAFPDVRERARAAGCAAFFAKPCLPLTLAEELRTLLYRSPSVTGVMPSAG